MAPMVFEWRKRILNDGGLTSSAKLVGLALSTHMDGNGGSCFPGIRTMAKECSYHPDTVTGAIAELEASKYLRVWRQKGRGSAYEARLPGIHNRAGEPDSCGVPPRGWCPSEPDSRAGTNCPTDQDIGRLGREGVGNDFVEIEGANLREAPTEPTQAVAEIQTLLDQLAEAAGPRQNGHRP